MKHTYTKHQTKTFKELVLQYYPCKQCMLFQEEENWARPKTVYAFSRRKQAKASNNACFFKKKTGQSQKQCMLFQEENRARPVTKYDFSRRRKQSKVSNKECFFKKKKKKQKQKNREFDSVVTLLCTLGLCCLQRVKIVTEAAWVKETKVS